MISNVTTLAVQAEVENLTTHFQAIMDLENWRVSGVEALARTKDGESAFPLLVRAQLEGWYDDLEIPLIEIAMRESAALPQDLLCTLNLSGKAVMSDELRTLINTNHSRSWGLELLEFSERIREREDFLARIQELGCPLYVDDAGELNSDECRITGLKPNVVKLDRNLLVSVMTGEERRERLESLIKAARASGSQLLAEGVETAEQLNFALELGCEFAQGWYFGHAVPAEDVAAQIAQLEQHLWIDAK